MKLIAREPTPEMLQGADGLERDITANLWRIMYDAAPEVKQEPFGYVREIRPSEWKFSKTTSWGPEVWKPVFVFPLDAQAEIAKRDKRIAELEERRCEICGYAEHHREHTGCLRVFVNEQSAEIARLKVVVGKCGNALSRAAKARISTLRNADPDHEGYPYKSDEEVARIDGYTLPMLEALAAIKDEGL